MLAIHVKLAVRLARVRGADVPFGHPDEANWMKFVDTPRKIRLDKIRKSKNIRATFVQMTLVKLKIFLFSKKFDLW